MRTACINVSPSGDPAGGFVEERTVWGSQADRTDKVSKIHRRSQFQKSDVVIVSTAIIAWVFYDFRDSSGHFICICFLLCLSAQVHS